MKCTYELINGYIFIRESSSEKEMFLTNRFYKNTLYVGHRNGNKYNFDVA